MEVQWLDHQRNKIPTNTDDVYYVLRNTGLEEFAANFQNQNVSPDIVYLLSKHEFNMLGIYRNEDMVRLRNECMKYGSCQSPTSTNRCGPPQFEIPKYILQYLIHVGLHISDIAKLLSVSERTIYRRLQRYGLSVENFSDLTEEELHFHIGNAIKEFQGENMLGQILKQKGFSVQRWRLRYAVHTLDDMGVSEKKKGRLQRRVYNVQGPNQLWHIDTNHKLIRWHFVIVGGIDGFNRLVTFLQCNDNNKAETVAMLSIRRHNVWTRVLLISWIQQEDLDKEA